MRLQAIADRSIVRLTDAKGNTLGTGFVIAAGVVMTCHHVVANLVRVWYQTSDDSERHPADIRDDLLFPESDIALIEVAASVPPLAASTANLPRSEFWTQGFHLQKKGFTRAVPVSGTIVGESRVSYPGGDWRYDVPVMLLDRDIDVGLSGAPLLDPRSGAVFGTVVAKVPDAPNHHGGLAISFRDLALVPPLRTWFQTNDETVAAFGPDINAAGAAIVCRRQVDQTIARLESEAAYLPSMFCKRSTLLEAVELFLESDKGILPIVGYAGVGKTTFLAHLAQQLVDKAPVLLLRGVGIAPGQAGIAALADRALELAAPEPWREAVNVTDLAAAARRQGRALYLLLDALNEHTCPARQIVDVWLGDTLAWLGATGARLIFTCRDNELWRAIEPRLRAAPTWQLPNHPEEGPSRSLGARLTDFSPEEVAEAATRYGVPALAGERLSRHPLALRLAWQLARDSGAPAGRVEARGVGSVIDALVARHCERLALELDGRVSAARIMAFVASLSRRMFESNRYDVSFDSIPAEQGAWADALVREHLLVAAGTAYRFAQDDVSDYLQSRYLRETLLGDPAEVMRDRAEVPLAVFSYAYSRLAEAGRSVELFAAVDTLCGWIRKDTGFDYFSYGLAVARRLVRHDAGPSIVERIVDACASRDRKIVWRWFIEEGAFPTLPVPTVLAIVHRLLPAESWYGWRRKDWQDPIRRASRAWYRGFSLGAVVHDTIRRDPGTTIQTLLVWIDEKSRLGEDTGEATIGDFAAATLFLGHDVAYDEIVDAIVAHAETGDRLTNVLDSITALDPTRAMARFDAMPALPVRARAVIAKALLYACFNAETPESQRPAVQARLVRMLRESPEPQIRYTIASSSLNARSDLKAELWPILREGILARQISVSAIGPYIKDDLPAVLAVLRDLLQILRRAPQPFDDAIASIWRALASNIDVAPRRVDDLLAFVTEDQTRVRRLTAAMALETLLYRLDARSVRESEILTWCERLLREDPIDNASRCLYYVAYQDLTDFAASAPLRDIIATLDVTEELFDKICPLIADCFDKRAEEAIAWMTPFRQALASDAWMRGVLRIMVKESEKRFAEVLEREWLEVAEERLPPGASSYLEARRKGMEPDDAAREAWRSLRTR